jgi:hypothetical protein
MNFTTIFWLTVAVYNHPDGRPLPEPTILEYAYTSREKACSAGRSIEDMNKWVYPRRTITWDCLLVTWEETF